METRVLLPAGAGCGYYAKDVSQPPEERGELQLLSVLYACVFWHGEARFLEI